MAAEVETTSPMSDSDHGAQGAHDTHGTADAGGHGHDAHGHEADSLGPVDVRMWSAGLLGVVAALLIVAAFVAATGFAFNA